MVSVEQVSVHEHGEQSNSIILTRQQMKRLIHEEQQKRVPSDTQCPQFVDPEHFDTFKHLAADPWASSQTIKDARTMFPGNRCEVLILGAGFSGVLWAVSLIETAGIRPQDIRIIDIAGGFGGTWYWNRFPGLMCDVEGYTYLPLLEETGYIPNHRYSYGQEIRGYINLIAQKWGFVDSAVFQTKAERLEWDETIMEWKVDLVQKRNEYEVPLSLSIHSRIVVAANGLLTWPKLPNAPGIRDFQGRTMHVSRWNYGLTGGSQDAPSLVNLQNKRVAIIGTGASGVQVIPHLARWSKHLYVVQRTPASVDYRSQHETDVDWFRQFVAKSKGWQKARRKTWYSSFTIENRGMVDDLGDQFLKTTARVGLNGGIDTPKTMAEVPAYIEKLYEVDLERLNRVRAQVTKVVRDKAVAAKLQPWYPSWCKRTCFHDEYLPAFNRNTVTLLDTDGKGIDKFTANCIIVNGEAYEVDIVIFGTGYFGAFGKSPAEHAKMTIIGPNGISMSEEWARNGPTTLHGVIDSKFPNLFLSGPWQAQLDLTAVEAMTKEGAYILSEARKRAHRRPFAISATADGVKDWAMKLTARAPALSALSVCISNPVQPIPQKMTPEDYLSLARVGHWGHGTVDYQEQMEAWRAEGTLQGIKFHI